MGYYFTIIALNYAHLCLPVTNIRQTTREIGTFIGSCEKTINAGAGAPPVIFFCPLSFSSDFDALINFLGVILDDF